jgi:hypothetical protein
MTGRRAGACLVLVAALLLAGSVAVAAEPADELTIDLDDGQVVNEPRVDVLASDDVEGVDVRVTAEAGGEDETSAAELDDEPGRWRASFDRSKVANGAATVQAAVAGTDEWVSVPVTLEITPPKPTITTAESPEPEQVLIRWEGGGVPDLDRYIVRRTDPGGGTHDEDRPPDSRSHRDTAVEGGETYTYRVIAVRAGGLEAGSDPKTVTVRRPPPPPPPPPSPSPSPPESGQASPPPVTGSNPTGSPDSRATPPPAPRAPSSNGGGSQRGQSSSPPSADRGAGGTNGSGGSGGSGSGGDGTAGGGGFDGGGFDGGGAPSAAGSGSPGPLGGLADEDRAFENDGFDFDDDLDGTLRPEDSGTQAFDDADFEDLAFEPGLEPEVAEDESRGQGNLGRTDQAAPSSDLTVNTGSPEARLGTVLAVAAFGAGMLVLARNPAGRVGLIRERRPSFPTRDRPRPGGSPPG